MADQTLLIDITDTLNLENLSANQTLNALIAVRQAINWLKTRDEALLDRLDELAAAGMIDQGGFKHAGWSFSHSDGRTSYDYPEPITQLEEQISAAKEAAKANGTAVKVKGKNAFWTITPPPPKKP
jgi:hypothetical protein